MEMTHLQLPHEKQEFFLGLAIVLTLVGRTMEAGGLLMQKHAHLSLGTAEARGRIRGCCGSDWPCRGPCGYARDKVWASGFVIYVLGHILSWVSMALGTQIMISCLMCWSTVVTVLLAPAVFGETVTTFRLCSIIMILFGATWVTIYGPRVTSVYTVDSLRHQFGNAVFQDISAIVVLALAGCVCVVFMQKHQRNRQDESSSTFSGFYLTIIAAMVGWYSVLFAKCTSGLLFTSMHYHEMQFLTWEAWAIAISMCILGIINLHLLNLALADGDATKIVPTYGAVALLGRIFIGGVFFEEFSSLSIPEHFNLWFGVASVVAGVIAVSQNEPKNEFLSRPLLSKPSLKRSTSESLPGEANAAKKDLSNEFI